MILESVGGGKALLFGGDGPPVFGDTWLLDSTGWTEHNILGAPARAGASVVLLNGKMVLFGGVNTAGPLRSQVPNVGFADTWIWDGATWTQENVSGPKARMGAAAATLNGKVMLFGGVDLSTSPQNTLSGFADTWVWDGVGWTQQNVPGPSARSGAAVATHNGTVVLFGGEGPGSQGYPFYDDTWTWDGNHWMQQSVSGPSAREGAVATELDGKVVLFGGLALGPTVGEVGPSLADTWVWDGARWTLRARPAPAEEAIPR